MSHGDELPETCRFGHVFEVYDHDESASSPPNGDIRENIKKGEITSLSEYEKESGTSMLSGMMGDHYKNLKVSASSQGTPYMAAWACADKFDEDLNFMTHKTSEDIFVSPQSQLHQEFMQRKQQAEQRVNQTLSGLSDIRKQKHMLEHDIRKLRSRAEAFDTNEETQLKADFVELVDGAGGGAQQGADEAPLKSLRDQNLYPSIVADFYEMESLDDLKKAEDREDGEDGKLAHLPANEKAILRKKWVMYEKWKDLYGSEIQRKLRELKSQLKNIERSIQQTEEWLEPYVRDVAMINQEDPDTLADRMTFYPAIRGTATMRRDLEFICYRPMEKEGGELHTIRDNDESEATHYKIVYIHAVHVNLAGAEQQNSPAGGPSAAKIFYYPAIVCRHVFQRFFQEKIDRQANQFREMMDDYTGNFSPSEEGKKMKEAREAKNWSVRKLRSEIEEEVGEELPIELSAHIRRVEDGFEEPYIIAQDFGDEVLEAIEEILGEEFTSETEKDKMYSGINRTLREFTGLTDPYVLPEEADPLYDLLMEMKFKYYYDFKIGLDMFTMK